MNDTYEVSFTGEELSRLRNELEMHASQLLTRINTAARTGEDPGLLMERHEWITDVAANLHLALMANP